MNEIIHEVEFNGEKIRVVDGVNFRHLKFGNSLKQSSMNKENPHRIQLKCMRDLIKVFRYVKNPNRILILGLGAGTLASYCLRTFKTTKVDAVEIVPQLEEIGHKYFGLPYSENLKVYNQDAYEYVMENKTVYDIIIVDVFDKRGFVSNFVKEKFYKKVSESITETGCMAQNIIIDEKGFSEVSKRLGNCYKSIIEINKPRSGNYIFFCFSPKKN